MFARKGRKTLTITDNPVEEFKFEMEEFITDGAPFQTLVPVSDSLILLRVSTSCHIVMHGLPVSKQF